MRVATGEICNRSWPKNILRLPRNTTYRIVFVPCETHTQLLLLKVHAACVNTVGRVAPKQPPAPEVYN